MRYIERNYPRPVRPSFPDDQRAGAAKDYAGFRAAFDGSIPFQRAMMGGVSRDITRGTVTMRDHRLPGGAKLRLYHPPGEARLRQGMLYIHGGGWFAGTIQAVEEYLKALSECADMVIGSVEYPLAPEHPYPAGLLCCREALDYLRDHAPQLGIEPGCVSVSGDSAGGNLAAALTVQCHRTGAPLPTAQVLLYPALSQMDHDLAGPDGDAPPFDPSLPECWRMRAVRDWYLPDGANYADPQISPLYFEHPGMLPPTLVLVCDMDGLMNQGVRYAQRLDAAGVPVTLLTYCGALHGFVDHTGTAAQGEDLVEDVCAFLGGGNP